MWKKDFAERPSSPHGAAVPSSSTLTTTSHHRSQALESWKRHRCAPTTRDELQEYLAAPSEDIDDPRAW